MSRHRRHQRFKLKSLYVWHRYIGLTAALFVILLSITGIALNHTEQYGLDSRYVHSAWLLDWYGIEAPTAAQRYRTAAGAVTLMDTQLFIDTETMQGEYSRLTGAVLKNEILIVGQEDSLLLFTADGQLIERLGRNEGTPPRLRRLGLSPEGDLILETAMGFHVADADYLNWTVWSGDPLTVNWATSNHPTGDELAVLQTRFRSRILPWERVMLDLHSGRIFGNWGPWLMDAAALLMLFLAGSGAFIWWKKKR